MIRIILADDHQMIRESLRSILERGGQIEVVAEAKSGREVLSIVREVTVDVIVMDICMPELNGIDTTREITKHPDSPKVLALSVHANHRFAIEFFRAGGSGYVTKSSAFEELMTAILAVVNGGVFMSTNISAHVMNRLLSGISDGAKCAAYLALSAREREVLQLVSEGMTTKEIAANLSISPKTVELHRCNLRSKLGINTTAGLVKYAIREGITDIQ